MRWRLADLCAESFPPPAAITFCRTALRRCGMTATFARVCSVDRRAGARGISTEGLRAGRP
ncbi:hypothetical protein [Lysobacter gummosus]|uniref:hypothetical protein n=1 Tax=Lysobacter gummosus TaxID=262324 RepID=UPI0036332D7B